MLELTPQRLQRFTPDEVFKLTQCGMKDSNVGAYPCMIYANKKNYDLCIYKLNSNEYVYDLYDEITNKKTQTIYQDFEKLLNFLRRYYA